LGSILLRINAVWKERIWKDTFQSQSEALKFRFEYTQNKRIAVDIFKSSLHRIYDKKDYFQTSTTDAASSHFTATD